jgi:monoamine oxidase
VAGLAAAARLQQQRRDVVIGEAGDRIGGRIVSGAELGPTLDLGASWVHGVRGNPITELAEGLDLETVETDYDRIVVYDENGSRLGSGALNGLERRIAGVLQSPQRKPLQPRLDAIRAELPEEEQAGFDYLVGSVIEHELAADERKLSDYAWYEGEEFGGGDVIHRNGYGWLPETLAKDLDVRLGEPVRQIAYGAAPITVATTIGSHTGAAVVVTVPLGVLKAGDLQFVPPLPKSHRRAIKKLGMGTLDKLYLRFDEVFWDTDTDLIGYVSERRGRWIEWYDMNRLTGEPILMGFNAGSVARNLERKTDQQIVATAMKTLPRIYR